MSVNRELELIQGLSFAHVYSRIFFAAIHFDIFNRIGEKARSSAQLVEATGASLRGIRMLLDCLVSVNLLIKTKGRYRLAPAAACYLKRGSGDYMGSMWEGKDPLKPWDGLEKAIRTGKPVGARRKSTWLQCPGSYLPLVRSLEIVHREAAQRAAQVLGLGMAGLEQMEVLDVACGSGVWGIAAAMVAPTSRITAQDLPEVLEVTRDCAKRCGVHRQFQYLPGDLRKMNFGKNRYDLAIAANIAHWIGERSSRDLLRRLYAALKTDGRIAVVGVMPNADRTGPPASLAFGLTLLLGTEEGDIFGVNEYEKWLKDAGFKPVEIADIASYSPLVIGHKKKS